MWEAGSQEVKPRSPAIWTRQDICWPEHTIFSVGAVSQEVKPRSSVIWTRQDRFWPERAIFSVGGGKSRGQTAVFSYLDASRPLSA